MHFMGVDGHAATPIGGAVRRILGSGCLSDSARRATGTSPWTFRKVTSPAAVRVVVPESMSTATVTSSLLFIDTISLQITSGRLPDHYQNTGSGMIERQILHTACFVPPIRRIQVCASQITCPG
jgi:hypothetical protein